MHLVPDPKPDMEPAHIIRDMMLTPRLGMFPTPLELPFTAQEADELAALSERDQLIDAGYLDAEPEAEPDRWPVLTNEQLCNEFPRGS